jgi:hypothetical protein
MAAVFTTVLCCALNLSTSRIAFGDVKSYLWVADPQVGFEIARKARDTMQILDPRLRGDDSSVYGVAPPAITKRRRRQLD